MHSKKEDFTQWLGHGTCSYICISVNVVANDITLQLHLRHVCYNIVFRMQHIF